MGPSLSEGLGQDGPGPAPGDPGRKPSIAPSGPKKSRQGYSSLMLASSIGFSVVIAILLGLFGGVHLDKWLGTAPVFTIAGLVAGVAAGFRNLFVMSARIDRAQKEEADGS
jgi:F0F1-type ATP synthase assembly protein I